MIVKKICVFFVLLMWVVFSSLVGIDDCVQIMLRNILNGDIVEGMMIVQIVFVSLRVWNLMYSGMVSSVMGSRSLVMIIFIVMCLFGKVNFVIVQLVMIVNRVLIMLVFMEYSIELLIYCQNSFCVQFIRLLQLVLRFQFVNQKLKVEVRLVLFFVVVMMSQYIGIRKYSVVMMSVMMLNV